MLSSVQLSPAVEELARRDGRRKRVHFSASDWSAAKRARCAVAKTRKAALTPTRLRSVQPAGNR